MSAAPLIQQINLSRVFGGGEAYALFFNRALRALGFETVLHVRKDATWWRQADLHGASIAVSESLEELMAALPSRRSLIVSHTSLYPGASALLGQAHVLTGFVHMPMWERKASSFADYAYVYPVSMYVAESLRAIGFDRVHDEPLYGVVDFSRFTSPTSLREITANPIYVSDRRKVRDALIEPLQPLLYALRPKRVFTKRDGVTLGILSMLGPIKQFPLLFSILAPVLARHEDINLEIFGYGGYGYVSDMRTALRPLHGRVRFWGAQTRPEQIYPQMDYLLSGLPEKEALGLNILEAQFSGTPVLAVNAPPFTETVVDGASGFLYRDPREDGGADFERVLRTLRTTSRLDPRRAQDHLEKFSFDAFTQRVARAIAKGGKDLFPEAAA